MTTETLFDQGAITIRQAAPFTALSRSMLYALMASGDLPYSRIRRSLRIPKLALIHLLQNRLGQRQTGTADER
jgi:excisionase family DNA binding protein